MAIQTQIHRRIKGKGRSAVFTPKDFIDLGSRAAVDKSLSRLTHDGVLVRLRNGVYHYPKAHPRLGTLAPDADTVARALVGAAPLQVTGAAALNALGLSTQVPARTIYWSDRSYKDVPIGRRVVSIRKASPRRLAAAGRPSGPVIQALKHLGPDKVDPAVVEKLRATLSRATKDDLSSFVKRYPRKVPDWMQLPVSKITSDVR
jgi:Family of unknown function (DUF6088)